VGGGGVHAEVHHGLLLVVQQLHVLPYHHRLAAVPLHSGGML